MKIRISHQHFKHQIIQTIIFKKVFNSAIDL